jgi:hypothetical protein
LRRAYGNFSASSTGRRIAGLVCRESRGSIRCSSRFAPKSPTSEFAIFPKSPVDVIIYFRLAVTAADLEPFLEKQTLDQAIKANKIFYIDLEILNGVHCQSPLTKVIFLTPFITPGWTNKIEYYFCSLWRQLLCST